MTRFKISQEWTITRVNDDLILSGGADMEYSHPAKDPVYFENLSKPFARKNIPKKDIVLFEQLLNLGVVVPVINKKKEPTYAVIGDLSPKALNFEKLKYSKKPDVFLIFKRASSYTKLLNDIDYQTISKPHLLVDISMHHTMSLGPFVFPGETACIACLQGRIEQRWGPKNPPNKPRVWEENKRIVVAILENEIIRIFNEDYSLVNSTLVFDIAARKIDNNPLIKTTFCPICSTNNPVLDSPLVLP